MNRTLLRLLGSVPTLFGVILVTFLLTRVLPGDPAVFFAGNPSMGAPTSRSCAIRSASTSRCPSSS